LIPVYQEIFSKLKSIGAEYIQLDEPLLACDLTEKQRQEYVKTYSAFKEKEFGGLKVLLATYFEGLLLSLFALAFLSFLDTPQDYLMILRSQSDSPLTYCTLMPSQPQNKSAK